MKLLEVKKVPAFEHGFEPQEYACTLGLFECDKCHGNKWLPRWYGLKIPTCGCDRIKHGLSKHSLYKKWDAMRRRCCDPDNVNYPRYGGRGITVCEEWMDFKPFCDWSLSNGWNRNLSIHRIDNNGPYSPINCKYTTAKEQASNKRTTKLSFALAEAIRRNVRNGMIQADAARHYRLSPASISGVINNKIWTE